MGPPKENKNYLSFFSYNSDESVASCKKCDDKLRPYSGNLKRHLLSKHPSLAINLKVGFSTKNKLLNTKKIQLQFSKTIKASKELSEESKQKIMKEEGAKQLVDDQKSSGNCDEFIRKSILLVATNDISPMLFDSPSFQDVLKIPNVIDSNEILRYINIASASISERIFDEMKDQLISIKYETVKKFKKVIIVVNVQYFCNKTETILIRTIGAVLLEQEKMIENLKRKVALVLKEFGISNNRIYSQTLDNGKNMIPLETVDQEQSLLVDDEEEDDDDDEEIKIPEFVGMFGKKQEIHELLDCVVDSSLKELKVDEYFKSISEFIKKLDSLKFDTSVPQWTSYYRMLTFINLNKDRYTEYFGSGKINKQQWEFIASFLQAFEPVYKTAQKIHNPPNAMSDFFEYWLECKMELTNIKTVNPFAVIILRHICKLTPALFDNNELRSAVYLDPRFNFTGSVLLTSKQKALAIDHLIATYEKLIKLCPSKHNVVGSINNKIIELQHRQKLCSTENVLNYWKSNENTIMLYELAKVVLSAPASRFSLQRAYNSLAVAIIERNGENLQNLVIINQNKELLTDVNFD